MIVHNVSLPFALRASGSANVTHVGCVDYSTHPLSSCDYQGGFKVGRNRFDATVRLVDLRQRAVVATWTAKGSEPTCPPSVSRRRSDTQVQVLNGPEPDFVRGLFVLPGIKKTGP